MPTFRDRFGGAALVTGASAGIGAAFAPALAQKGMDLILVARRGDRLQSLAAEISRAHGVRAEVVALDLLQPGATAALVRAVETTGLEVGLLVCSAGFGTYGPFEDLPPETEARMVDLNCRVVVEHCHAFIPAMVRRRRGGVILLASIGAYQPCPYWATYGATKAFNLMLGEALWAELRPHGVDVLALSPGYTTTEFQEVAGIDFGIGRKSTAADVVPLALRALGRKPSTVYGLGNRVMVFGSRLAPRRVAAAVSARMSHPGRLRKTPRGS